jgi:hypothetical protein
MKSKSNTGSLLALIVSARKGRRQKDEGRMNAIDSALCLLPSAFILLP